MDYYNGFTIDNQQHCRQMPDEDLREIKSTCRHLKHYHVIGHLKDESQMDGILEDYDDHGVTMLVPEDVEEEHERQYGYGRRRFHTFRRRHFPYYSFCFHFSDRILITTHISKRCIFDESPVTIAAGD